MARDKRERIYYVNDTCSTKDEPPGSPRISANDTCIRSRQTRRMHATIHTRTRTLTHTCGPQSVQSGNRVTPDRHSIAMGCFQNAPLVLVSVFLRTRDASARISFEDASSLTCGLSSDHNRSFRLAAHTSYCRSAGGFCLRWRFLPHTRRWRIRSSNSSMSCPRCFERLTASH